MPRLAYTRTLAATLILSLSLLVVAAWLPSVASAQPQLAGAGSSSCGSNPTARFDWQPAAGTQTQWLDLSVTDNRFAEGTFSRYGPIAGTAATITWPGVEAGAPHFWRVWALTPTGWTVSETGTFVPCAGPRLLSGPITCEADGTATVHFRWAPSSLPSYGQWLDLSVIDNSFAPGTFSAAGPLAPDADSYSWGGIQTNTWHVFRVNALTDQGWQSSQVGSFVACPPARREPFDAPPPVPGPEVPGERWVLVDIERQEATAMIGDRPFYTALVTTGKEGWETPRGTFSIIYRVFDETMTSASIGAEDYYVLEHVLYTQYFTYEGHALHLNYWRPDYYFGEIASSHGCVGMRLAAAEFFWRFAGYGTRVVII